MSHQGILRTSANYARRSSVPATASVPAALSTMVTVNALVALSAMATASTPAAPCMIAPLKVLPPGQVIRREHFLAIPPSKATYTRCACKLPNRRRSFYCNFLESSSEGPSADNLMYAGYTWTVDGSTIHLVQLQRLLKRLSIQY